MPSEVWRPVLGYEGLYEASNMGNVRSLDREVGGRGDSTRTIKGKIISPRVRPDGTLAVNLWFGNTYVQRPVKRIVLEAFTGRAQPNGYDAKNMDDDPANCKLANLRWKPVGGLALIHQLRGR